MSGYRSSSMRRASLDVFDSYVSCYDVLDERISLKVKHTYEVADLCCEIARGEGMPAIDIDLAWLCGLLHDIGRFEQLRRWGTFNDSLSCSHAALGLEVLGSELSNYTRDTEWSTIIRKAVAYHSDLVLPEGLTPRERLFCTVVRDADKVDILRVFSESSCEAVLGVKQKGFAAGEISDAAMAGFNERRCLARDERSGSLDGLLGAVCLVFELESPSAREALRERGYLQRLLSRPFGLSPLFDNQLTQQRWNAISGFMSRL